MGSRLARVVLVVVVLVCLAPYLVAVEHAARAAALTRAVDGAAPIAIVVLSRAALRTRAWGDVAPSGENGCCHCVTLVVSAEVPHGTAIAREPERDFSWPS